MGRRFKEKISTVLDVPQEIVMDVPRIVFDSNTKVFIENYKGISEYANDSIKVNAGRYIISISGTDMEIKSMTAEEVFIEGWIKSLDFS